MWGEILGAMIGPGMEGIASAAQYQAAKHERNISWKRMAQWELMGPGLRMQGLRNAGLNPILAATGGFKGGGAPNVPEASVGGSPSFSFDLGQVYSAAKQRKAMNDELEAIEAGKRIRQSEARAAEFLPEKANFSAQAEQARWEVLREQVALLREQQDATSAQAAATRASQARTELDTELMSTEMPARRALESLYEEYPWLRKVGAAAKDVFGR